MAAGRVRLLRDSGPQALADPRGRAARRGHTDGRTVAVVPASPVMRECAWRSDRKLRMLLSRPQFRPDGVLKCIAVPHFVSNHGAD